MEKFDKDYSEVEKSLNDVPTISSTDESEDESVDLNLDEDADASIEHMEYDIG